MGQSGWTNVLSSPVTRSGDLQSALNGCGMGAEYPFGNGQNIYGQNNRYNNNNPSLYNSRPEGQYKFIASTSQEGNYWILMLKDSTNTIRMKGSYSDQEMTIPDDMFYYYHSNGNTSMNGMYQKAQRNGIWISNFANGKYECILFNMEGTMVVVAHWWDPALTKKSGLF